jgi:hypothetical protein
MRTFDGASFPPASFNLAALRLEACATAEDAQ